MSHKHPWRGLFVAAALLLTAPAFSQEPVRLQQDNGNFGPLPMPFPPFANINLSDDQVGRLAHLKRAFETGIAGSFASLRMLEDDMRDKLAADNINESDVRKLAEEIAHQKADMSKRFSAHILEAAKVLTAEQRQKIRRAQDRMELGPLGGFGPHPPIPPHLPIPPHPPLPPHQPIPPHSPESSK